MKYKTEMKVLKFMHSPKAIPTLFRGAAKALCAAATALTLYGAGLVAINMAKAVGLTGYSLPFSQCFAINSAPGLFIGVMALAGASPLLKKINKTYRWVDHHSRMASLGRLLTKQP